MQLVDTHCHIHSADYPLDVEEVIAHATAAGVTRLLCVGTTAEDSELAVQFAATHDNCWASIGLHPHDAKLGDAAFETLRRLASQFATPLSAVSSPGATWALSSSIPIVTGPDPKAPPKFSSVEDKFGVPSFGSPATGGDTIRPEEERTALGSLPTRADSADTKGVEAIASVGSAQVASEVEGFGAEPAVDGLEGGAQAASEVEVTEPVTDGAEKGVPRPVVAVGECGLDYFYHHSSKEDQARALRFQIELALEYNLPMIFHVREAFDDFWPIFDSYQGIRGVLHSFTDNRANLDKGLERGLCIGVNGIATFTKNDWQRDIYKAIPLEKMILETDAPFLTPVPLRGTINEPANAGHVCKFLAELRQEPLEKLADATTHTALNLFALN
jgi:TatD family hydrolase